jgi:transcription-repair coupling factor (superfamily II helicase)
MEKVILKNETFVGFFISNQLSPFYRSPIFAGIIGYIQHNPKIFQMKEQREKLSVVAKGIKSTSLALELLKSLDESLKQ